MSYDEIKLAAMVQFSSPVKPLNPGSRNNHGRRTDHDHVRDAVYVGAVGARMEKVGVMELQECEITEKSIGTLCLTTPWVMKAFAEFYGRRCLPQDINSPGVIRMREDIIGGCAHSTLQRGGGEGFCLCVQHFINVTSLM